MWVRPGPRYSYDAIGRLIERKINGADPTTYAYDRADRIKTINFRGQSVTYTYDSAGRLTGRTLPNGIIQSIAYNAANELLAISYKTPIGALIEELTYTYGANGNPIARTRQGLGSVPETPFTATYDANNRMLTYNGQPLSYDANGNLISRETAQGLITYTWDTQDRLTDISGPNGTASFKYDYAGRRFEKTVNGVTTAFLYDGAQAIAELQGSAIGTTYLTGLQIDEVLARYSASGNRTLLTDALGSVLAQTDDSQTSTSLYAYSPYGEVTQVGENDNSLQYTGRENDDTGLYYYRARYYDPGLKRFISEDPIRLSGGVNVYAYVLGNPMFYYDPDGQDPTKINKAINALNALDNTIDSAKSANALNDLNKAQNQSEKASRNQDINKMMEAQKNKRGAGAKAAKELMNLACPIPFVDVIDADSKDTAVDAVMDSIQKREDTICKALPSACK